jgi:hypothetical protein
MAGAETHALPDDSEREARLGWSTRRIGLTHDGHGTGRDMLGQIGGRLSTARGNHGC